MCVGVPAQVVSVDPANKQGVVEVNGVRRGIDISLVVDDTGAGLHPGEWVLLHVGFAMSIIDEDDARKTLELLTLLGGHNEDFSLFTADGSVPADGSDVVLAGPEHQ